MKIGIETRNLHVEWYLKSTLISIISNHASIYFRNLVNDRTEFKGSESI